MKFIKDVFELFEIKGDWALYLNRPVYKEVNTYGAVYIINTKTGKNCGQHLELRCKLFDELGNKLETPIYEEDCYEIIEEG